MQGELVARMDTAGLPQVPPRNRARGGSLHVERSGHRLDHGSNRGCGACDIAAQPDQSRSAYPGRSSRGPAVVIAAFIIVASAIVLREQQKMSRAQLSSASGLSVRFIGKLERGKAHDATLTDVVRISFGLNYPVTDLVNLVDKLEKKLKSK
jgi:helix-turn-helix protein